MGASNVTLFREAAPGEQDLSLTKALCFQSVAHRCTTWCKLQATCPTHTVIPILRPEQAPLPGW